MKKQQFRGQAPLGLLMLMILVLSSCGRDRLAANKNIITESRNVSGFEQVEAGGGNNVHVSYGENFKVELRGSSNLIAVFEARVNNKVLSLGYKDDLNIENDDVEVFVTMPTLNGVSLNGSGNIEIRGSFPDAKRFSVEINGSGDVGIEDKFRCSVLEVDISGSGKAELSDLQNARSKVKISGSGDTYLQVEEELDVKIDGSGTVYYRGTPRVSSDINGSGQVRRI